MLYICCMISILRSTSESVNSLKVNSQLAIVIAFSQSLNLITFGKYLIFNSMTLHENMFPSLFHQIPVTFRSNDLIAVTQ